MKQLLLLLLAIAFFGCGKKSPEPEPTDLAEQVAGKYLVYETVVDTKVEAVDPKEPEGIIEITIRGENDVFLRLTNLDRKIWVEPFSNELLLTKKGTAIKFSLSNKSWSYGLFYNQVLELNDGGYAGRTRMLRAKRI